jgi:hypothetical protein
MSDKSGRYALKLHPAVYQRVRELAAARELSLAAWFREAIREKIRRETREAAGE